MRAAEADPAGKHFAMHKARYGQLFWQSGITGSPGGQQSIGSIMPAMSAGIPPRAVAGKGATTSAAAASRLCRKILFKSITPICVSDTTW